jgi:hypothetical protein
MSSSSSDEDEEEMQRRLEMASCVVSAEEVRHQAAQKPKKQQPVAAEGGALSNDHNTVPRRQSGHLAARLDALISQSLACEEGVWAAARPVPLAESSLRVFASGALLPHSWCAGHGPLQAGASTSATFDWTSAIRAALHAAPGHEMRLKRLRLKVLAEHASAQPQQATAAGEARRIFKKRLKKTAGVTLEGKLVRLGPQRLK